MRISAADIPARERFDFWLDRIRGTYVELDVEPEMPARFEGDLDASIFGETVLAELAGTPQRVARTPRAIARCGRELSIFIQQVDGRATIEQDGRTVRLNPGEGALIDTTRPYRFGFDGRFRQRVLHCPRAHMRGRISAIRPVTAARVGRDTPVGLLLARHLDGLSEVRHALDDRVGSLALGQAFDLIAAALAATPEGRAAAASPADATLVGRIKAHIRANLTDPDLGPGEIAAAHGLSLRHLHRLFRAEGVSVSDWLRDRRLELAHGWLTDPSLARRTVTEIAYRAGFKDGSHFSRLFRARYGAAPRDVRPGRG